MKLLVPQKLRSTPAASRPQPLTMERITDLLEEKEITYFIDQEGDVMTLWDNVRIYFRLSGEDNNAMQVLGRSETRRLRGLNVALDRGS